MRKVWSVVLGVLLAGQVLAATGSEDCSRPDSFDQYVLAMTWQPGFCEHVPGNGDKPECRAMMKGTLSIDHLTLHGLWPHKVACGIGYGNCRGPRLQLQPTTIAYIQPWMPNWYYSSNFGDYEWRKHGTCQTSLDDDQYFVKAVASVMTFDSSPAGQYLKEHQGQFISRRELEMRFNQAVGDERAADNLSLLCKGESLYEIRLLLAKEFEPEAGIDVMVDAALPEKIVNGRDECGERIWIERSGR